MTNQDTVRTLVLGFTQTQQWFTASAAFATPAWALLWANGGGVDRWRDPDFAGWSQPLVASDSTGFEAPQRVLLTISGPYEDDVAAWAEAIRATATTVRLKYPSVEAILLQPIVGGPEYGPCLGADGVATVRAARLRPIIDQAIAAVAGGPLVRGLSPEVRGCADFANATGHLTPAGAAAVGDAIAAYYDLLGAPMSSEA